jgi:hypothetical protein
MAEQKQALRQYLIGGIPAWDATERLRAKLENGPRHIDTLQSDGMPQVIIDTILSKADLCEQFGIVRSGHTVYAADRLVPQPVPWVEELRSQVDWDEVERKQQETEKRNRELVRSTLEYHGLRQAERGL